MTHPTRSDLERFFNPQSIAIIGASQDLVTISGQPLRHLKAHGYRGTLYPVNPRYPEILGHKCYPSLADVPESPDVKRTFDLFAGLVADAALRKDLDPREKYDCRRDLPKPLDDKFPDPKYTVRAWRAVVTYLLRQHEFLYE